MKHYCAKPSAQLAKHMHILKCYSNCYEHMHNFYYVRNLSILDY